MKITVWSSYKPQCIDFHICGCFTPDRLFIGNDAMRMDFGPHRISKHICRFGSFVDSGSQYHQINIPKTACLSVKNMGCINQPTKKDWTSKPKSLRDFHPRLSLTAGTIVLTGVHFYQVNGAKLPTKSSNWNHLVHGLHLNNRPKAARNSPSYMSHISTILDVLSVDVSTSSSVLQQLATKSQRSRRGTHIERSLSPQLAGKWRSQIPRWPSALLKKNCHVVKWIKQLMTERKWRSGFKTTGFKWEKKRLEL